MTWKECYTTHNTCYCPYSAACGGKKVEELAFLKASLGTALSHNIQWYPQDHGCPDINKELQKQEYLHIKWEKLQNTSSFVSVMSNLQIDLATKLEDRILITNSRFQILCFSAHGCETRLRARTDPE